MLTGRVPFDADTPVSVALKHMQEKPVEPIKLNPSVPFAVNQIIMKAMQKEVSMRYQSATEMLRDLSLALKNPDGNFVVEPNYEATFTQRIPTINSEVFEKKINNENNNRSKEEKSKKSKVKPIVFIIGFIMLAVLCFMIPYFVLKGLNSSPKNIDLVDVTGLTISQANEKLRELKIEIGETKEEYNSDVEKGKIISQDPKPRL